MGKYQPLQQFLEKQKLREVPMSFAEVERVLGFKLPPSQNHRAWWSNNPTNNVMTKAWLSAGYETEKVDLDRKRLVFKRIAEAKSRLGPQVGTASKVNAVEAGSEKIHPLIGWMKGLTKVAPGVDLTEPSDPDWGKSW